MPKASQGQYRQPENSAQPIVFHMHMDHQKGPLVNIQESEQTIPTYAKTKKNKTIWNYRMGSSFRQTGKRSVLLTWWFVDFFAQSLTLSCGK
jgi:hypothetical protein